MQAHVSSPWKAKPARLQLPPSPRLPEGDSPPRLPEGPRGGREVRVRQLEVAVPGGRCLPPPLLSWWQETQPPVPTCSQESCQCRTHDQVKKMAFIWVQNILEFSLFNIPQIRSLGPMDGIGGLARSNSYSAGSCDTRTPVTVQRSSIAACHSNHYQSFSV